MQARQYENDLKRVRDDHRIAVREINLLKDELARLRVREVMYNSFKKIRSKLSLHSLYYGVACYEFAEPITVSLRPNDTAAFEEMSQRWQAVSSTVTDLIGPRFEPQTSRSRNERVTEITKNL